MLQEVYDHAGHCGSKIILDHFRFQVYWPRMVVDVREYIWGCLPCAKWAISARSIPLTPIQTGEPYELIGINVIGPFEKSAYGNTYINNLIDHFSRHMYPHPISGASTNNVIISFNHSLRANAKLMWCTWMLDPISQVKSYVHIFRKKILQVFLPLSHLTSQLI